MSVYHALILTLTVLGFVIVYELYCILSMLADLWVTLRAINGKLTKWDYNLKDD